MDPARVPHNKHLTVLKQPALHMELVSRVIKKATLSDMI